MDEHEIRDLIDGAKAGRIRRRRFVQMMVRLGPTEDAAVASLAKPDSGSLRFDDPGGERKRGAPLTRLAWAVDHKALTGRVAEQRADTHHCLREPRRNVCLSLREH